MRENGFLESSSDLGTVGELIEARGRGPLFITSPNATMREVIAQMKARGISQLPVVEQGKLRGVVAEVDLLRALLSGSATLDSPIAALVESEYASVTPNTKVELLQAVLAEAKVAIVEDADDVVGVITRIDLIDFFAKRSAPPLPV
jgi:cystathionine beta-synthase